MFERGWADIGRVFGVSKDTIKAWHRAGAPIIFLGRAPVTELGDLWGWMLAHRDIVEDAAPMSAKYEPPKTRREPSPFLSAAAIKKQGGGLAAAI